MRGGRLTIVRPSVPAEIRVLFARVSITGALVWAVAALFLSVVPSYAAELLDTSNLALLGAVSAAHARRLLRRPDRSPAADRVRPDAGPGLACSPLGLLALALAFPPARCSSCCSPACSAGAGHGLGFLGGQAQLNLAAPPDSRGAVNAAFYTLTYLGVAAARDRHRPAHAAFALATAVTVFAATIGAAPRDGGVALKSSDTFSKRGQARHSPLPTRRS